MKGSFIKMKKLIALLLAVSALAMSTVAFADTYTTFDIKMLFPLQIFSYKTD